MPLAVDRSPELEQAILKTWHGAQMDRYGTALTYLQHLHIIYRVTLLVLDVTK